MPFDFTKASVTMDFAQRPAGGGGGVETFERYNTRDLANGATYTPTDEGLYSVSSEHDSTFAQLHAVTLWGDIVYEDKGWSAMVGVSSNFRIGNDEGAATNLTTMRHHYSTATYEQYHQVDLAAGTSYTPTDEGLFSFACERIALESMLVQYRYNADWWTGGVYNRGGDRQCTYLSIGDGANLRFHNFFGSAREIVINRAVMIT